MTMTTSNMYTNTNSNVFPDVEHGRSCKRSEMARLQSRRPNMIMIMITNTNTTTSNMYTNTMANAFPVKHNTNVLMAKTVVTVVFVNNFVNKPPPLLLRPWQQTLKLKLMWQQTLKLTDNAMKLMEKGVELFGGYLCPFRSTFFTLFSIFVFTFFSDELGYLRIFCSSFLPEMNTNMNMSMNMTMTMNTNTNVFPGPMSNTNTNNFVNTL